MIVYRLFILAIAIISITQAEPTELEHTERIRACLQAAARIQGTGAGPALTDHCSKYCSLPCKTGYICRYGVCVDKCTTMKCAAGYRCLHGQCRQVMGCGQRCDNPKWICALGVSCINGKCTGRTVSVNGACGGSTCNKCKAGTRCYKNQCKMVMKCGDRCDYPKWICSIGAYCNKHRRCDGLLVGEGASCGAPSCNKCKAGTQCYLGKCRKEMGCDQECDYPIWVCKSGLSCRNSKCQGPVVKDNDVCGGSSCSKCKTGSRCYQGRCRKEMTCGQTCDYPKWICKSGLSCFNRKCFFGLANEGEKCSSVCKGCKAGHRCHYGICRKVMGCGQKCGNPKWICASNAKCEKGYCKCNNHILPPCRNGVCPILPDSPLAP